MNPLKVDKIQYGFSAQNPYTGRNASNGLTLFDEATGAISLGELLGERNTEAVRYVSQGARGADVSSIQSAIDALPATGGVVVIFEGEYTETLSISKPVYLIGRGHVVIQADATIISAFETSLVLENISLKILDTLAAVECIEATSVNNTALTITLRNCSLDSESGAIATGINSLCLSVYVYNTLFSESAAISCASGNELRVIGHYIPRVELVEMAGTSYLSAAKVGALTLTDSAVCVAGKLGVCVGDAGSSLETESISGSVEIDNTAIGEVEFACPLATTEYFVLFENLSSREVPVITARSATGFSFETSGNITETVRWVVRA